jgi:oxalate---CoA ligase
VIGTPAVGELVEPLSGRAWDPATTHRQWRGRARLYANGGVGRGDLVFLHRGTDLEFFGDLLALWSLGACVAPIDPRLTRFEVETLGRFARPRFSIGPSLPAGSDGVGAAALYSPDAGELKGEPGEAQAGARPEDDALVLFTSGSTGSPKGVVHTHRSLQAKWSALREHVGVEGLDRTLCVLPVHFGHGLICNALYPWLAGGRLAVVPPFRPDVIPQLGGLIDGHAITFMSSVPALWRLALRVARRPRRGTLARVFCGSAPLSSVMWRGVREWAGAPVSNAYGLTETASWIAGTAAESDPEDGLVGHPWGATLVVTGDPAGPGAAPPPVSPTLVEGPVWVRTPALMRGYLGQDALTREVVRHGWLETGDIGCLDRGGRLYLRGRRREEINRGGVKVYPGDVEAIIEQFGSTLDSCAFGYEDELGQEEVAAAVVLRPGDPAVLRQLHAWARSRLAGYQMPRRWYVLDEIPRTAAGKVSRAQIAARCAGLRPVDPRALSLGGGGGPSDS